LKPPKPPAEDLGRLVDLLEAPLRRLVLVDVGVMLARQLAIGRLDLFLAGGLRDAEAGVIVFEVHVVRRSWFGVRR
jgi:hypothetical protein